MKRVSPILCPAVGLPLPPIPLSAADRGPARPENKGDGFEQLFNGKDLHGWKGDTNVWSVQSSSLIGRSTPARPLEEDTSLIWTNGTVHDFELHLAYKITPNNPRGLAHSAIQYRSRELTNNPTPFLVAGYQAALAAGQQDQDTGI